MNKSLKHRKIGQILRSILFSLAAGFIFYSTMTAQSVGEGGTKGAYGACNLEEIYLQTDRDIYVAGEEVFFRTLQSGRLTHDPGTISKVVYVDLLDSYRTPVIQVRTGTDGVTGAGVFRIPDTLRTGHYFLRSFTNLMKNYPQALFAYKRISVINPFENLSRMKIPPSDHQPDSVVFYLETGYLISGLQTRTGVKCFNGDGDPVMTNGLVMNNAGDTLARFRTDRHGTALFTVTPPDNSSLFLIASDGKGTGRRFAMPPVRESGLMFKVSADNRSGALSILCETSEGFKTGAVSVSYSPVSSASLEKKVYPDANPEVTFAPASLPEGLARITVREMSGAELGSRWYYRETKPDITFNVFISSDEPAPREKAEITIKAVDGRGNPVATGISVAVVKPVLTVRNHYSDLARRIQLPSMQAFSTEMNLPDINDYLIFCDETSVLDKPGINGSEIIYLPEPEGHLVRGYVRDRNTGEPLAGEGLSLSLVGRTARCSFTTTGAGGEFSFPVREYGRKEIVIQRLSPESNGYFVDLNDPFLFEMRLDQQPGAYYPDTTRLNELNEAIISMQVRNIYDPFLKKKNVKLFEGNFPDFFSVPDRTIILSDFIELTTLREAFKEIVPGLSSTGRDEKSSLRLVNRNPGMPFSGPPLVIIDGVPVYDLERVLDIPSSTIEKIEVLNTRYFIGGIILDGIINIVSRKGDLSLMDFDRSIFRQEYNMLLDSYSVVAPDYSSDTLKMSRIPDYRNTLYWNPAVASDNMGNASVTFWTSDESGEYIVIVEGVTADGRHGRSVTSFSVVK